MKLYSCDQGGLEWLRLHVGIPTASVLDQIVDSSFKPRTGQMVQTLLHKKLAEWWRGQPLIELGSSGSFSTEQGMLREEDARPWFEFTFNKSVKTVGFITTDDGKFGCSPDGMIDDSIGMEIKCPAAHTHVKYLLGGIVPPDYIQQVHGSMYATGFKQWIFLSYRHGFPPLIITVNRDEKIIDSIQRALDNFYKKFEDGKKRIEEMEEKSWPRLERGTV